MMRLRKSAPLIFALSAVAGLVTVYALGDKTKEKLAAVQTMQRNAAIGVHSLWVDDCGGIAPEPEMDFPNRLTTPFAYLKPEDFQDPFANGKGQLLFLPSRYNANTGAFAIVSRGPDGDLDCDRLPRRDSYYMPIRLPESTRYAYDNGSAGEVARGEGDILRSTVASYTDANGKTVQNPKVRMRMLPEGFNRDNVEGLASRWMAENGVAVYDPTNGTVSDGDIVAYY